MKVPYYELLNPKGFRVRNVGRIHSPRLNDINEWGYENYQYALSILLSTPDGMLDTLTKLTGKDISEDLSEEEKATLTAFDLLMMTKQGQEEVIAALAFFISEPIEYDEKLRALLVNKITVDEKFVIDGAVTRDNWGEVCDICLQTACIEKPHEEQLKFKNEASRKFYEKFQKKKAEYEKMTRGNHKANPDLELANIISALATNHNSLNYTNIYNLTVYQLHDTFNHQNIKKMNDIHDLNYSVWGGEYKPDEWYKRIKTE